MKTTTLILTIFGTALASGVLAQQTSDEKISLKGKAFTGGAFSVAYSNYTVKERDGQDLYSSKQQEAYFIILPMAGYFVSERFALGLGIGYENQFSKSKDESSPSTEYKDVLNSAVINSFVRCHRFIGKRVSIFGQADVRAGFGKGKLKDEVGTITYTYQALQILAGIKPGLMVFVTDRIAVETSYGFLGYSFYKTNTDYGLGDEYETKANGFNFNFGFSSLYFGMQFYLGRKNRAKEEK